MITQKDGSMWGYFLVTFKEKTCVNKIHCSVQYKKQLLTFSNIYCGGQLIGSSQDGGELLHNFVKSQNLRIVMASPSAKVILNRERSACYHFKLRLMGG